MQNKSTSSGCNGAQQGSNCVIWTGQPIPALGIEKGENITDIVCSIASQVVALATPLDLSTVSIQCLIDQLGVDEPVERTIANMLQIAYDSSCDLKSLVDQINAKLSGGTSTLTLNLGCLTTFDVYGNPLPYNEQSVLQTLITTACGQSATISSISGTLQVQQAAITALQNIPQYIEPTLTSCLFTNRKTSDALVVTASALCTYMGQVGQSTDINNAISKVPTAWTANYGLLSGWILNPTNLAQSYSNLLLVVSDLYTQLNTINSTCCQANCSDVIVDFDIKLSSDRTSATLFFAAKSSIPAGFRELNSLGDQLTVTDGEGNVYTTYINTITQVSNPSGLVIDLNGTAIDPSSDYTFNVNVSLTNGTLTCVKCITHTATFKDTCSFCTINVTSPTNSSSDKVVIVYNTNSAGSAVQYVTIYAGQTQAIPATAQITSLTIYGSAQYTSTCTLPSPSIPSCYEMTWGISVSNGGHDAIFTDAYLQYINVLGVQYPISCNVGGSAQATCYTSAFTNFYPATIGLMSNLVYSFQAFPQFYSFRITFQTTAAIAASMQGFVGAQGAPTNGDTGQGTFDGFAGGAFINAIPSSSPTCTQTGGGQLG